MENTLKSHLIALMANNYLPLTADRADECWNCMVIWWENTFIGHRFNWNTPIDNFAPVFVDACENLIMDILLSIA